MKMVTTPNLFKMLISVVSALSLGLPDQKFTNLRMTLANFHLSKEHHRIDIKAKKM